MSWRLDEAEVAARLHEAAELTRLCLSLPRLPTRGEQQRMARFDAWLERGEPPPDRDTVRTAFELAWAARDYARIVAAARRLPDELLGGDDRIETYVFHARELAG